ncbi:MAG TPA: MraY family glycosyltransferase [Candidatus Acidoferrales bacterium]|nr:MraY family glycosyltransferase [Candidatus Acidoferrales bacterium]
MSIPGAIAGAFAFVLAILLVPAIRELCFHAGILDAPGPLKIHSRPVPRLGGVAIAIAVCIAIFLARSSIALPRWPFFAALGLVWAVGFADDLRGLSPYFRLAAQLAAGALLWLGGWRVPIPEAFARISVASLAATCLFVSVFLNAYNLVDGADGIAAGVACISAVAYAALPVTAGHSFAALVAWSLAGACGGFLVFNFPTASIYLGDCGSTLLGFGIAFLGLNLYRSSPATGSWLVFPVLIAGLPLLEVVLAVIRRLRDARSPLHGDLRHISDLLRARGWPPRRVALVTYGITAGLAAVAWPHARSDSIWLWVAPALSMGVLLAAAIRLGSLQTAGAERPRRQART